MGFLEKIVETAAAEARERVSRMTQGEIAEMEARAARFRAEAEERRKTDEAERAVRLASLVRTSEHGVRYVSLSMAGPLRNGNELGGGRVMHAVRIDGVPVSDCFGDATALCGRFPSITWSRADPDDPDVTCPRCISKLERIRP